MVQVEGVSCWEVRMFKGQIRAGNGFSKSRPGPNPMGTSSNGVERGV